MIIENQWTITRVDTTYCKACKKAENSHTITRAWIYNDGELIGRCYTAVNYANDCKVVFYLETWEDTAQAARAIHKAENDPAFKEYSRINIDILKEDKIILSPEQARIVEEQTAKAPIALSDQEKNDVKATYNQVANRMFLSKLAKHKLNGLIHLARAELNRRYKHSKEPKYGNISRGFEQQELEQFLSCCHNPRAKMIFELQAYLGLRIGEAVSLEMGNIHPEQRKIYLQTEKAQSFDYMPLHDRIYWPLKEYIAKHQKEIQDAGGKYLFPAVKTNSNKSPHLSAGWVRKEFRKARRAAGLSAAYGKSNELANRRVRPLYRLSTHSLRHFFITSVYKSSKDPMIAQKLARHKKLNTTQIYIHLARNDMDNAIKRAFERI